MKVIILVVLTFVAFSARGELQGWLCESESAMTFELQPNAASWAIASVERPAKYTITPSSDRASWWLSELPSDRTQNSRWRQGLLKMTCPKGPDQFGRLSCTGFGSERFEFRADTANYVYVSHENFFLTQPEMSELAKRTAGQSEGFYLTGPYVEIGRCKPL